MSQRQYKQGIDRQQGYLLPPSLEEYITDDNPVKAIESYVESLDLEGWGFQNAGGELTPGQPAYSPQALLKLYLYGYIHRIRSSRRLEAECRRNLEVIWLLKGLRPGYKTIANFRKENLEGLKKVNQDFVQLCKELELFGGELVGIDGSFFRGNVAKSRIYTQKRLKQALANIERDIARYLEEMNQADQQETDEATGREPELAQKLKALYERQNKRTEQLSQLEASGETQVAEVDEDARLLSKKGHGTIAGYNVQVAVDAKHKLLLVCAVTQDGNDEQQLAPMGLAAKAELGVKELETTQDVGYFSTQQIKTCGENGITPFVPEPDKLKRARTEGRFSRNDFYYDAEANVYRCPANRELKYSSSCINNGRTILMYKSSVPVCAACQLKDDCLPAKTPVRAIGRWEHEAIIDAHRARMAKEGAEKMRHRSGLCEHPFGTLKMWCGWTHFLLRGLGKVKAEMSLLMLSYNFKRVLNICGLDTFRDYCKVRRLERTGFSG